MYGLRLHSLAQRSILDDPFFYDGFVHGTGREYGAYAVGTLQTLQDQLRQQFGTEKRLVQDTYNERHTQHGTGPLVMLLEDLDQTHVVERAVVLQQHHLSVESHDVHLYPCALLLAGSVAGVAILGVLNLHPFDPLLQLVQANHVLFLLLNEEVVELVQFNIEQPDELLILSH
ncbi:hypothetical protein Mapa_014578 [Marchantia paleacea]|nr:hypothetical protein Mapa_014578 [Marchantia paleacea]